MNNEYIENYLADEDYIHYFLTNEEIEELQRENEKNKMYEERRWFYKSKINTEITIDDLIYCIYTELRIFDDMMEDDNDIIDYKVYDFHYKIKVSYNDKTIKFKLYGISEEDILEKIHYFIKDEKVILKDIDIDYKVYD